MPLFPSREWMDVFCVHLTAHAGFESMASRMEGVYRFVVEPSGPLTDRHGYDVRVQPGDDLRPACAALLAEPAASPTLSMSATYERWRQLIMGELDVGMAVISRRLKVSGDLTRLLSRLESASPLIDSLRQVETEWS